MQSAFGKPPRGLILGLAVLQLVGCSTTIEPGNRFHAHGQLVVPADVRTLGFTAAKHLPAVGMSAPPTTKEAIRYHALQTPAAAGDAPSILLGMALGAALGASVGVDAKAVSEAERTIQSAFDSARLDQKLRAACYKRFSARKELTLLDLPDGVPWEPYDWHERRGKGPHPLAHSDVDTVVGVWFSSIGFRADRGRSSDNMINSPLRLLLCAEVSTVRTRDWSTVGGVSVYYLTESQYRFFDWSKNEAALLCAELEKFWSVLDQEFAMRIR